MRWNQTSECIKLISSFLPALHRVNLCIAARSGELFYKMSLHRNYDDCGALWWAPCFCFESRISLEVNVTTSDWMLMGSQVMMELLNGLNWMWRSSQHRHIFIYSRPTFSKGLSATCERRITKLMFSGIFLQTVGVNMCSVEDKFDQIYQQFLLAARKYEIHEFRDFRLLCLKATETRTWQLIRSVELCDSCNL